MKSPAVYCATMRARAFTLPLDEVLNLQPQPARQPKQAIIRIQPRPCIPVPICRA